MNTKSLLSVLALVVVVLAGGAYIMNKGGNGSQSASVAQAEVATAPNGTAALSDATSVKYKDGTYSASGDYRAPSGAEMVNVTLTLKGDIIVDSTVVGTGRNHETKDKQADFIANYKQFVTGKNIDEVNLSVVSGSSLTSTGFNAAVEKIKTEAKA